MAIKDSDSVQVCLIQRKYKNSWDKLIHYLPLSFLETITIDE
ncbi:tubby C-terminal domain-like protein [Siminovitchia fordii]